MSSPPRRGDRAWMRAIEDASLQREHPQAAEAAARFDALASTAARMALAREIVDTRARELTLAYRNVVMVTAGFKARAAAGGSEQVHPEPCVIFVVRRKWVEGTAGPVAQRLPSRLLTYGVDGKAHRLFAVPTDVQPASWYAGGATRARGCVQVDDPVPAFRLLGTIACGVRAEGALPAVPALGLSAMHVLSPVAADPLPASGAAFTAVGAGAGDAVRGRSAPWGGAIDADTGRGFDAQLAQIDDARWFNDAYRGWKLSRSRPYVVARDAFDELAATRRFLILAPDNHPLAGGSPREPMLAQFTAMAHEELPLEYQVRRGGALHKVLIRHPELIRLRVLDDCPPPLRGDSGSAVLSWWPDDSVVFVGLFIASGDGPGMDRVAYAIPAWQLFDPLNWRRLPPGTSALTPRFRVP